jgi:hypothetical protein
MSFGGGILSCAFVGLRAAGRDRVCWEAGMVGIKSAGRRRSILPMPPLGRF